jgi:hypothetical protein
MQVAQPVWIPPSAGHAILATTMPLTSASRFAKLVLSAAPLVPHLQYVLPALLAIASLLPPAPLVQAIASHVLLPLALPATQSVVLLELFVTYALIQPNRDQQDALPA